MRSYLLYIAEDHGDEDHGDEDHGDEDHGDKDHCDEDHAVVPHKYESVVAGIDVHLVLI